MSLTDPSNRYVFLFESFVVLAVKDVLNDIWIRNEIGSISQSFDHCEVLEIGFESWDDGGICKCFPSATIAILAGFFAVLAMRLRFVWTDIADTRVDTTIIRHRMIGSQEFNTRFRDLERRYIVTIVGIHDFSPGFF